MTAKSARRRLPVRILFLLGGSLLAFLVIQQALALSPADSTIAGRLHIVQSGENLASIAESHSFDEIALRQLNGIEADQTVWTGQPLLMPPAVTEGAPLAGANSLHRVAKGETLHSIAVQYGLHPVELAHMNRMSPNDVVYVGKEVRVPSIDTWAHLLDQGYMRQFPQHIVQAQETPASIAQQFGVTEETLRTFNALMPTDMPAPGTALNIPPRELPGVVQMDSLPLAGLLGQLIRLKERWVDIDLDEQTATAFEGMTPIRTMEITSGQEDTPTVTGFFRIWAKTATQDMSLSERSADDYDLDYVSNVPWVQYFYRDFAIHGAYWTLSPGQPSSTGNILLSETDAKWLYNWTSPNNSMQGFEAEAGWILSAVPGAGTLVFVHD